jgi:hypothetical protein
MSLLSILNLSDIQVEKVKPINGLAILGEAETKESASGEYINVSIPLFYVGTKEDPKNLANRGTTYSELQMYGVVGSYQEAQALGLSSFNARFNIKPEWFMPEFSDAVRTLQVDPKEAIMYQINVAGITRTLFRALGQTEVNFDLLKQSAGEIVGFKASSGKNEPDKNQIRSFFYARRD